MRIIRARHLGMCFGVRDAINLARRKATEEPLTILGELVHNETVLESLRREGVQIEQRVDNVTTRTAMITAHGASELAIRRARERGLNVVQATCPLVHFAHRAVAQLVEEGFHPVIIGKRDHVEVRGMVEDLAAFDVILSESDIQQLAERSRFGVVAQTTQPIEKVHRLVSQLRQRFLRAEVRFSDTVCQPTKQRQSAAVELAQEADIVIVVGGSQSNNTRELAATCSRYCSRVFQVQTAGDIQHEWLHGADTIGLTAGTSTPDSIIDDVEQRLKLIAASEPISASIAEQSLQSDLQPV